MTGKALQPGAKGSHFSVEPYSGADAARWDEFVERTAQGTFLHTRRFLSYHGERFVDRSLLVTDSQGDLQAVMPVAQSPMDPSQVVSHPGITYGGLLHLPRCAPSRVREMLAAAASHLGAFGYRSLIYKAVPVPVQRTCVQADVHALWNDGARLVRRDLWNAVGLQVSRHPALRHLRDAKRARNSGLVPARLSDDGAYSSFHLLLSETLAERHGIVPVHTLEEMLAIRRMFAGLVELWGCVAQDGRLLAGIWLFRLHETCWHTQYIAANGEGRKCFATDLLLAAIVESAIEQGVRYLTQGTSTENAGKYLNDSLFSFKSGIGAGSVVHDFYEMDLQP